MEELQPSFKDNFTTIAMSSSNEYVPYLSVCLESLKTAISKNNNYDIIIFERSITDKNKSILKRQVEENNVSLRFVNPVNLLKNYNLKYHSNYNLECYFRLTSPLVLKNFEKVLFTDVDLLFKNDPAIIYNTDVSNYPLAACQDLIMSAFVNNTCDKINYSKYLQEELGLTDVYKYFNTGIMLINIEYFNKNNLTSKILELCAEKHFRILEQDGLNSLFKDNIKYIDTSWNFPVANFRYESILNLMPKYCYDKYQQDFKSPNIIHYAGSEKPWNDLKEERVEEWWYYARKTPFYERLLLSNSLCLNKYIQNLFLYYKYRILENFVFGITKKRYIDKKRFYKYKLNQHIS